MANIVKEFCKLKDYLNNNSQYFGFRIQMEKLKWDGNIVCVENLLILRGKTVYTVCKNS